MTLPVDKKIRELLDVDPAAIIEEQGMNQREAMILSANLQIAKEKLLRQSEDTYLGMKFIKFVNIMKRHDFKIVQSHEFSTKENEDIREGFFMFWNPALGMLVAVETITLEHVFVNQALAYYSCEFEKERHAQKNLFSGKSNGKIIVGFIDAREGFLHKLRQHMGKHGKFLNPWPTGQHLFFCCSGDRGESGKIENGKELSRARYDSLPEEVRKCVLWED